MPDVPEVRPVAPPAPVAASPVEPTPAERLRHYLRRLRRRWMLIVLITVLVTAAAAAVALSQTKQYDATATLYFPQTPPVSSALGIQTSQPADTEREANTNVALVTSPSVAAGVITQLNLHDTIPSLLKRVRAAVSSNSDLVAVTASTSDPHQAAALANAFAAQYVSFRKQAVQATIDQAISQARRSLAALPSTQRHGSQGSALQERLRQLQTARDLQTGPAQVLQAADAPNAPSSPHPKQTAALGFGLGLVLAITLALTLDLVDRRLKDDDEIREVVRAPTLAAFPRKQRRDRPSGRGVLTVRQRRAAGVLASGLRLSGADNGRIILAGVAEEADVAQVALGLAGAIAHSGHRALILQIAPEGSMIDHALGFVDRPGIASALSNPNEFEPLLIPIGAESMAPASADRGHTAFEVLPIGYSGAEYEDLTSPAMRQLLRRAERVADTVIVAVATVQDALPFFSDSSTQILIVRQGSTSRDAAAAAVTQLDDVGVRLRGVVITHAEER